MKERLTVHLRGLPQIVESWNRPEDTDSQPSQFARSLTKVECQFNVFLSFCYFIYKSLLYLSWNNSLDSALKWANKAYHFFFNFLLILNVLHVVLKTAKDFCLIKLSVAEFRTTFFFYFFFSILF